eukprot:11977382-Prorocentrum_lima.AAC.1
MAATHGLARGPRKGATIPSGRPIGLWSCANWIAHTAHPPVCWWGGSCNRGECYQPRKAKPGTNVAWTGRGHPHIPVWSPEV